MSPTTDEFPERERVEAALDPVRQRIRGHAGEVSLVSLTADGVATVAFHGACVGCPAISATFTLAVEPQLMAVEGVTKVESSQVHISAAALERMRRMVGSSKE